MKCAGPVSHGVLTVLFVLSNLRPAMVHHPITITGRFKRSSPEGSIASLRLISTVSAFPRVYVVNPPSVRAWMLLNP